jgi:hypothetical protein
LRDLSIVEEWTSRMRSGIFHPDGVVFFVNPVLNPIAVVNVVLEETFQLAFYRCSDNECDISLDFHACLAAILS